MKIEVTNLLELDEALESQRLQQAFKPRERKAQQAVFDAFVAQEWSQAAELLDQMTREQLEGVHPVILKVLEMLRTRENLTELFNDDYFDRIPETQKVFGSLQGKPVSRDGLSYPKFRVLSEAEHWANSVVRAQAPQAGGPTASGGGTAR